MIRRLHAGSGFDDSGNEKRFVNIDAATDRINNFHGQKLLSWYKKRSHWLYHHTINHELKQFLVYVLKETLICA